MKFGKRLLADSLAEWKSLYVDYKSLKGASFASHRSTSRPWLQPGRSFRVCLLLQGPLSMTIRRPSICC